VLPLTGLGDERSLGEGKTTSGSSASAKRKGGGRTAVLPSEPGEENFRRRKERKGRQKALATRRSLPSHGSLQNDLSRVFRGVVGEASDPWQYSALNRESRAKSLSLDRSDWSKGESGLQSIESCISFEWRLLWRNSATAVKIQEGGPREHRRSVLLCLS